MNQITADQLTSQEQIHLAAGHSFWKIGGASRLGIPAIKTTDASNGIREQYKDESYSAKTGNIPALCYPSLCACGCSFDTELLFEMGKAIGEECARRGISVLLGPGLNLKRHPLCGRNFEYISEDPVLSGKLGAAFIRGVQSAGVAACPKHFAANNQETRRMKSDSVVDAGTLFELYLRSFEIAVKEGHPWAIMSAYNKLNGTYCAENAWLLDAVLRQTWGFDGAVISDWGGVHNMVASLNAGLDVEMPGGVMDDEAHLAKALWRGQIRPEALQRAAGNILKLTERTERSWPGNRKVTVRDGRDTRPTKEHLDVARRMAEGSFVLLKNEGNLLPLKKDEKILVLGSFAKLPRYQGSGSGKVKLAWAETPWMVLKERFSDVTYLPGYDPDPQIDNVCTAQALEAGAKADKILVFAGVPENFESEGFDREHMKLPPEQNKLIKALSRRFDNIVVLIQSGAPVETLWKDEIPAVLLCYLSGSCFGSALANVLDGTVNPSGRLAESWPFRLMNAPASDGYPSKKEQAVYAEGTQTGYRFYEEHPQNCAWFFGSGLSYTTFAYRNLRAVWQKGRIAVSCRVKNTGSAAGAETVQIYLSKTDAPDRRVLAAFTKVFLAAGEERKVSLTVNPQQISLYDPESKDLVFAAGDYVAAVGKNCMEMLLKTGVTAEETLRWEVPVRTDARMRTDVEAETVPDAGSGGEPQEGGEITANTSLRELEHFRVMRPVVLGVRLFGAKSKNGMIAADKVPEMVLDTPFRLLPLITNGKVKARHVQNAAGVLNRVLNKKEKGRKKDPSSEGEV